MFDGVVIVVDDDISVVIDVDILEQLPYFVLLFW